MTKQLQIYKCELRGNIIEVLHGSGGQLKCCGESMTLYSENSTDAALPSGKTAVIKLLPQVPN